MSPKCMLIVALLKLAVSVPVEVPNIYMDENANELVQQNVKQQVDQNGDPNIEQNVDQNVEQIVNQHGEQNVQQNVVQSVLSGCSNGSCPEEKEAISTAPPTTQPPTTQPPTTQPTTTQPTTTQPTTTQPTTTQPPTTQPTTKQPTTTQPTTTQPTTTQPTTTQPTTTVLDLQSRCDQANGFMTPSQDECFVFDGGKRSWDNAQSYCTSQQLRMGRPNDDNAIWLRKHIIDTFGTGTMTWAAGRGDGTHVRWADDNEIVSGSANWYTGYYGHYIATNNCLRFLTEIGHMNGQPIGPYASNADCSTKYRTLCELI